MNSIKIGDSATFSKVFNEEEVKIFSELSGDVNPIHLDSDYAKKTFFKKRIVHGFLYSSLISAVIANQLPGEGSIYLNQTLKFIKPVFLGDKVTAKVTVIDIRKDIIELETICHTSNNNIVINGNAIIKKT